MPINKHGNDRENRQRVEAIGHPFVRLGVAVVAEGEFDHAIDTPDLTHTPLLASLSRKQVIAELKEQRKKRLEGTYQNTATCQIHDPQQCPPVLDNHLLLVALHLHELLPRSQQISALESPRGEVEPDSDDGE